MAENKEQKSNKTTIKILVVVVFITILTAVVLVMAINGKFDKKEKKEILTSSTLMEVIDIAELSTSQFTYNGIATIYNEKKPEKIDCQIKYDAVVKAKVNMKDIKFDVNEATKKVNVILPEITLNSTLITDTKDGKEHFSYLPEKTELELKQILEVCEKDAEEEAKNSKELLNVAEENLKDTITALLYPIVNEQGFEITWNEVVENNDADISSEVEVVENEIP